MPELTLPSLASLEELSKASPLSGGENSELQEITELATKILEESALKEAQMLMTACEFEAIVLSTEHLESVHTEIADLLHELRDPHSNGVKSPQQRPSQESGAAREQSPPQLPPQAASNRQAFSSPFALAASLERRELAAKKEPSHGAPHLAASSFVPKQESDPSHTRYEHERPRDQEKEREGKGGGDQGKRQSEEEKAHQARERLRKILRKSSASPYQASTQPPSSAQVAKRMPPSRSSTPFPIRSSGHSHQSMDNIFIRFMAIMARILGQAEREANELYQKIKHRTDDVDTLTLLLSKLNTVKGKVDWSKDEEMKTLVQKARDIGVEIPAGKLTWTEDEKKLLRENIQMKKESMEKITQLERTDMQRFLQEASQCHQARSNILKLLKEVLDTIIHNFRTS